MRRFMNKYELTKEKVSYLIAKENKYDFPQFLTEIRKCFGLTRRSACKEMQYPEMKMFHLESGTFRRHVPFEDIIQISEYYDVDSSILKQKADEFISEGKGIPQNKVSYYVKKSNCKC